MGETRTPDDYLRHAYSRVLTPALQGGYTAAILEFPGCYAEGATPHEALVSLERAAHAWLAAALKHEQPIPAPVRTYGYSGKIALRVPKSLHREVALHAARDGVSVNTFLVALIARGIGALTGQCKEEPPHDAA